MTISTDKQYRTRDGREVRIYAVDTGPNQPVHGAYCDFKIWRQHKWEPNGKDHFGSSPLDLIEVKPRIQREYWVNVYDGESVYSVDASIHKSMGNAANFGDRRIACVKITIDCEEGEGL